MARSENPQPPLSEGERGACKRMIVRTFRYRLQPTEAQRDAIGQISGACRFVYNVALEQWRDFWRQYQRNTGHSISYIGQSYELTELRRLTPWIAAIPRDALDMALHDLDRAYQAFFAGRAKYPTMRKRSDGCGFSVRGRETRVEHLNAKWAVVKLPKVGLVKFRISRPIVGEAKITSVREVCGEWFVSFSCAIELGSVETPGAQVGIDRGVTNTLSLSTGEHFSVPLRIAAIDRLRKRAQRTLARRRKGSNRRAKAKARVARLCTQARRMRQDWAHRTTTSLTRRFGLIAIEALNVRGMTASGQHKRGLNRSILAQGWGEIERQLAYKLETTGGVLVRVPAPYTSQTCQACGAVDRRSRESQATFRCVHCGHEAHADTNAALEILRRSTASQLAEGTRWRPDETRTTEKAA